MCGAVAAQGTASVLVLHGESAPEGSESGDLAVAEDELPRLAAGCMWGRSVGKRRVWPGLASAAQWLSIEL